jgi:hypothetical protein
MNARALSSTRCLFRADFQGASLDRTQFQGASLDGAQLQGASLDGAQLQGASLRHALVWRADAQTADMTDAFIKSAETGAKQTHGNQTIEWSAASFAELKQRISKEVPPGVNRANALKRLERLDPNTRMNEEEQLANRWTNSAPEIYETTLAKQLRQIGCSPEGAPCVLAGMIRIMASQLSPFTVAPRCPTSQPDSSRMSVPAQPGFPMI